MQVSGISRALTDALSDFKRLLVQPAAFSFFINVLMLTGPLYMLQVYDRVVTSRSVPTLIALTVLILFLYAALGALLWVRNGLLADAASRFEQALSRTTADAAFSMRIRDQGAFDDRTLSHLRRLRNFLASPVIAALLDAPFTPLFFLVLFALHPAFGIWAIISAAVLLVIGLLNQRTTARSLKSAESLEDEAQTRARELFQNAEAIEAMGMRDRLRDQWRDQLGRSDQAMRHAGHILSGFDSVTRALRLFMQSAILGLGAYLAIHGSATFGAMIAASILMGRAIAPIEQLVASWKSVTAAYSSWGKLRQTISEQPLRAEGLMQLPPLQGHVAAEKVYVVPQGAKEPVLKSVSFSIEPGDALGLLGSSAAGKTTLLRTLAGVTTPASGHVRLDGADIADYPKASLGAQIGYLPQQIELLSGSVQQNIARFDASASSESVIEAARLAGCHDMILRLSSGYDTEIGSGGAYLSAGQRQRIGLARALYGRPRLVILDEPNSNLDLQGETALQQAILSLRSAGSTLIIVAHRPQTVTNCNKLLILDNGEVQAFGPKDEILAKLSGQTRRGKLVTVKPAENSGQG